MNKNIISRVVLSILLIVFMYIAAACSVSNDKKSKKGSVDPTKDYQAAENAKKSAFADEAMAFLTAGQEAYISSQLTEDTDKTCFTVKELIGNYITAKDPDIYRGIVERTTNNEWVIYISNGKYSVNGKSRPINKDDVLKEDKV